MLCREISRLGTPRCFSPLPLNHHHPNHHAILLLTPRPPKTCLHSRHRLVRRWRALGRPLARVSSTPSLLILPSLLRNTPSHAPNTLSPCLLSTSPPRLCIPTPTSISPRRRRSARHSRRTRRRRTTVVPWSFPQTHALCLPVDALDARTRRAHIGSLRASLSMAIYMAIWMSISTTSCFHLGHRQPLLRPPPRRHATSRYLRSFLTTAYRPPSPKSPTRS
jgi:hypothetical protein